MIPWYLEWPLHALWFASTGYLAWRAVGAFAASEPALARRLYRRIRRAGR